MSGYCVKTGAVVLIVDTGEVGPADLFLVGNALVARFPRPEALQYAPEIAATHAIRLSSDSWYRRDLATAVVPLRDVSGPLVLRGGREIDAHALAMELAR